MKNDREALRFMKRRWIVWKKRGDEKSYSSRGEKSESQSHILDLRDTQSIYDYRTKAASGPMALTTSEHVECLSQSTQEKNEVCHKPAARCIVEAPVGSRQYKRVLKLN